VTKLFTAALLVFGAASLGVAGPFVNGGFETVTGPVTPPVHYIGDGDTILTGWLHTGPGGFQQGEFLTDGSPFGIGPGEGFLYVGFGAGGFTGGSLSQTFDTEIGQVYLVNYLLTTQELGGPLPDQVAIVEAFNGATLLAGVTNTFNQPAGVWNSGLSLVFTATSASTTLRITDGTLLANSANLNWGLDDVNVLLTPEPATFGLIGIGLGLIYFRRRKGPKLS
jgi:hypothetical protein